MPKESCEYLVDRRMIALMPENGVVIDATACDKDLIETAISSSELRHIYKEVGQWHYNCDHIPALVPVTSTATLTSATLPYVLELAEKGFNDAVRTDEALAAGVVCTQGKFTHQYTCNKKSLDFVELKNLI